MNFNPVDAEDPKKTKENLLRILVWVILLAGISIRVAAWLQNKNLLADEAILANNIFTEGIHLVFNSGLPGGQHVPPLYGFLQNLFTATFGFSEMALRLLSLISGSLTLILLYNILKRFLSLRSYWYSLLLMATAYVFVYYTTEARHYMTDVMVTLALMLLAFRFDIRTHHKTRFVVAWSLAGIIATWLSTPAVFTLGGVAVYYVFRCREYKRYSRLRMLSLVCGIWLLQFIIYYILVLHPWMQKGGLNQFSSSQFLQLMSVDKELWQNNLQEFGKFFTSSGGDNIFSLLFNAILLLPGIFILARRHPAKFMLVLVPVTTAVICSAFGLYPFLPRLMLFAMPCIFIFIGYGFEKIMQLKQPGLRLVFVVLALASIFSNNIVKAITQPEDREQLMQAIKYMQKKEVHKAEQVYVHNYAVPAYKYYTRVHPEHKSEKFINAHFLEGTTDYKAVAMQVRGRVVFLYTNIDKEELTSRRISLEGYLPLVAWYQKDGASAYVYDK